MPIRNSKVSHDESFRAHRRRRLSNLEPQNKVATEAGAIPPKVANAQAEQGTAKGHKTSSDDTCSMMKNGPAEPAPSPGYAREPQATPERGRAAPKKNASESKGNGDRIQLRMTVPHPARGSSPTFDTLAKTHGDKTAFRLVMGKALEDYAASISTGAFLDVPNDYPEGETIAETSRMFPRSMYARAVTKLNPTGLLSERMIATAIGRCALAAFIREDRKRHGA